MRAWCSVVSAGCPVRSGAALLAYPLALLNVMNWLGFQEAVLPVPHEPSLLSLHADNPQIETCIALGFLIVALLISMRIEQLRLRFSLAAIREDKSAAGRPASMRERPNCSRSPSAGAMAAVAGEIYAVVLVVNPGRRVRVQRVRAGAGADAVRRRGDPVGTGDRHVHPDSHGHAGQRPHIRGVRAAWSDLSSQPAWITFDEHLNALKLQREFDALAARAKRPALALQRTIDPQSGRPIAAWAAREETAAPTVTPEPAFV